MFNTKAATTTTTEQKSMPSQADWDSGLSLSFAGVEASVEFGISLLSTSA